MSDKKCIGCGKEGEYHIKFPDVWVCEYCSSSVYNYIASVNHKSPFFQKYTWEGFFNKFNYGKNKKSKL